MANTYSQIPQANNLQFVKEDVILPAQYHFHQRDEQWYLENLRDWQNNRPYHQPIQQDDKQYIELHRADNNDVALYVYDANFIKQVVNPSGIGDEQYKLAPQFVIFKHASGSVYTLPDGTEVQMSVHKWHFRFSDFNLDDGIYYVRIPVQYYDGVTLIDTKYWISEPISVKDDHPDTILIGVENNSNKDDIISVFDASNTDDFKGDFFFKHRVLLRVEGDIIKPKPENSSVSIREQDYEAREVKNYSWDSENIYVGNDFGVPYYMISKINFICGFDVKKVEGRRFEKFPEAELQIDEVEVQSLYTASLKIEDYYRTDRFTDTRGQKLLFCELTGEYPVAIYRTGLGFGRGVVLDNNTERDAYISDLNGVWSDAYGLNGTFLEEDENIYYQCATGENFIIDPSEVIYEFTKFYYTVSVANQRAAFILGESYGIIDWDDDFSPLSILYQQPYSIFGGADNRNFTYSATGDYELRLFAKNITERIEVQCATSGTNEFESTAALTNISETVPQGLRYFQIYGVGSEFTALAAGAGFNMNFLEAAKKNIRNITFNRCGITKLDGNVFANYSSIGIGGNSANWSQLTNHDMALNGLSQVEEEDYITNFYDHCPHISPGTLYLNQSPANTITDVTAIANVDDLILAGWSVIT